jgi:hypothetical protein
MHDVTAENTRPLAARQHRMTRRKRPDESTATSMADLVPPLEQSQVFTGNLSLHEMFQKQVRETLDQSDLDEDSKQAVLVAMSCPCCGAGAMNYTVPLKRKK